MSPLRFQKRIRLQEARALLVSRPDDVAGVGHLVGYESPSHFSREYRRLFGAHPARTRHVCVRSPRLRTFDTCPDRAIDVGDFIVDDWRARIPTRE